jgi:hypothetical protein
MLDAVRHPPPLVFLAGRHFCDSSHDTAVPGLAICRQVPVLVTRYYVYADYACWQQYLGGLEQERQMAYWREHLEDAPGALDLPSLGGRDRICVPRWFASAGSATVFPSLQNAERELLLSSWNCTAGPLPTGVCIHELFEARVVCAADRIALADGQGR